MRKLTIPKNEMQFQTRKCNIKIRNTVICMMELTIPNKQFIIKQGNTISKQEIQGLAYLIENLNNKNS